MMKNPHDIKAIINDNSQNHSPVSWWPKYAYHYTDVNNAVSILSSGKIYSRANAEKLDLMQNDGASRQVIDVTKTDTLSSARFYFRPLTPTQYHTEGYKHPQLRYDGDINANVPVPVFLLFDLDKLLLTPGVQFSENPQSGHGSATYDTIEEFSKFDFDKIYSNSWENFTEEIKYRHAEILYPDSFDIDDSINVILCRNSIERTTLLTLLKHNDKKAYKKFKSIIKVCRENMFEKNGLFVTDCRYSSDTVSITLSNTYEKSKYTSKMKHNNRIDELDFISGELLLVWKSEKKILKHLSIETKINYSKPIPIAFENIPNIDKATTLKAYFFIEENLMCCIEYPLDSGETF